MERLEQPITMTVDYLDSEAPGNKPPPSNKAVPLETSSVPEAAGGDYIAFPEEEKLHSLCTSKPCSWKSQPTTKAFTFLYCRAMQSRSPFPTRSFPTIITGNVLTVTSDQNTKTLVQACYISLFAIFGVLLRMIIAQLFGEECANPGTVGWLAASSPLCVTADGSATQSGGIVFADLPSNILGSFLMGIFQDGAVLNLAVPLTIAWVAPNHPFQSMAVLHKAFTTGFCGSLTTFSSWNAVRLPFTRCEYVPASHSHLTLITHSPLISNPIIQRKWSLCSTVQTRREHRSWSRPCLDTLLVWKQRWDPLYAANPWLAGCTLGSIPF